MPQDAFTLRLVAKELDETLRGGRINKVNQPTKEEVSLIIYTGKRVLKLVLNVNASDCGVYFTEDDRENPLVAPNFCMLLRKHLQNAEILSVTTAEWERIIHIRLACHADFSCCERELILEVMGKYSNLLLVENEIILGALKTTALDVGKRAVFSGAKYTPPLPQDKVNPLDVPALNRLFAKETEVTAHFLFANVSGIAPRTAERIIASYEGGDFTAHLQSFLFTNKVSPCVVLQNGRAVDFSAIAEEDAIFFDTLSGAQSYFYGERRRNKFLEESKRKLSSVLQTALKKQQKRLQLVLEKLQECEGAELCRIKGELITSNLYALKKGMNACELVNYYDEEGKTLKIALDSLLSPAQNAQNYYKRYRKLKRAQEFSSRQREETQTEIDYLSSLVCALSSAETLEDCKCIEEELQSEKLLPLPQIKGRKKKEEIPFRRYEQNGMIIWAGRNNLQNDALLRRASPEDIWFHAQKYHSCHVIAQTEGKPLPDGALLFCAKLCAKFSSAKGERIPVDYCPVKFVKKTRGAKAGFVTYTNYQTIYTDGFEE